MRCFSGFQPRTDPAKDVLRLATMCGPSNGMRALTGITAGKLLPGQPAEHSFSVAAGDCFRVFAVAGPEIRDLDVEVLDRRSRKLAADVLDDRWPVVGAAGPVCAVDTGRFRAVVSTPEGGGQYAIQIWVLK